MSFQGSPPFDDAAPAPAPGPELGGALPVRVRPQRAGSQRDEAPAPSEPFAGCPLFPVDSVDARGVTYRDKFAACGFTQEDAEGGDLGLRIRLESPDGRAGGTSKATFQIPLLPLSTTQEAILDRWGPGKYEVTLCRRSGNDRIKSGAKSISRNVTLMARTAPEFGHDGEFDVGDEAWPIDPDDGSFTAAMRAEMERREEIREGLAAQDVQDRGTFRDDARGRPDPYAGAPQHPPAFGPPAMDPRAYPPGTTFTFDAMGRPVPAPPTRPSATNALLDRLATDPVATITALAAAAAGLKSALGLDRPPPPSAQEVASATSAAVASALAPVLQALGQAVTQKPAGPDPMQVVQLQIAAQQADSARQLAEFRAQMEAQRLQSEQAFKLQIAQQQHEMRARELMHKLDTAKSASDAEKGGLLKELSEVRKKLQAGEVETAPGLLEQMGDVLDTKFGEALAPMIGAPLGRLIDAVASGSPSPQPAPPRPVAPVFAAPQYPAPSAAPAPAVVPDESADDADEDPSEVE